MKTTLDLPNDLLRAMKLRAVHEGRVFGTAHRWSVIAGGLAMLVLAVLGVLLWWRSRRRAPVPSAARP